MKKITWILILFNICITQAQDLYLHNDEMYRSIVQRYAILSQNDSITFSSTDAYYSRKKIADFSNQLSQDTSIRLSKVDKFNLEFLKQDNHDFLPDSLFKSNNGKFFRRIYQNPSYFTYVKKKYFTMQLSPVFNLSLGKDLKHDANLFHNSRGLELRGIIDDKVGFYTVMTENQAIFPSYVYNNTYHKSALYGMNFWKKYRERGFDYFLARGYITTNLTKHIHAQFGYDRNFIGDGYRSLILSDVGAAYTFLKLKTKIWKFDYTNIFADLTASLSRTSAGLLIDGDYPTKQLAFHHLGINLSKNFKLGVFESVMYGKPDSLGGGNFNINYMNPIIFYRAIEQNLGSGGNALLGLDFNWIFLNHFSLYGQFVLDEFKLEHIKAQDGWWANKQAVQLGLKYVNAFGINNLDIQGEFNYVRPYTYGHRTSFTNYSHFNQTLAHPLGANFYEFVGIIQAQPFPKLTMTSKMFLSRVGRDTTGTNWGGDFLQPYSTREQNFGNTTSQGFTSNIFFWDLTLSYQLRQNFFIDIQHVYRKETNELSILSNENQFLSVGLRLNMRQRLQEF